MKKNFLSSLDQGNKGQKWFTDILDALKIEWSPNKTIEYDVVLKSPHFPALKYECKYDVYAARSGNLAIETWNTKKNIPSGISATTADYWIHILSEKEIWVCPVTDLRSIINRVPPVRIVDGGDNNSQMMLFRKEDILLPPFSLLTESNFYDIFQTKKV